ncbi:MAG: hypothetical protein ACLUS6_14380 [Dysosmobacter sp.]
MSELKGACIIGQSGGPDFRYQRFSALRCDLEAALDNPTITRVFGMRSTASRALLNDRSVSIWIKEDRAELELLTLHPVLCSGFLPL